VSPIENADRVPISGNTYFVPQRGQSEDSFNLAIFKVILTFFICLE